MGSGDSDIEINIKTMSENQNEDSDINFPAIYMSESEKWQGRHKNREESYV